MITAETSVLEWDEPATTHPPYTQGPPLDGGAGPGALAGNHGDVNVSGTEIGIIVGIVGAITLTLIGLFIWRARRLKQAAKNRNAAVPAANPSSEGISQPITMPKDDRDGRDDRDVERFSTTDNDKILAIDQQPTRATPIMSWKPWAKSGQRDGGRFFPIPSHAHTHTSHSLSLSWRQIEIDLV